VTLHPVTDHVVEISSSEIRSRLAAGRPVRWFLPGPVADQIESQHLYR
jgi:nicotinic acid mononucleotide adenylyltransferase